MVTIRSLHGISGSVIHGINCRLESCCLSSFNSRIQSLKRIRIKLSLNSVIFLFLIHVIRAHMYLSMQETLRPSAFRVKIWLTPPHLVELDSKKIYRLEDNKHDHRKQSAHMLGLQYGEQNQQTVKNTMYKLSYTEIYLFTCMDF
jgi:hypothetical protein